MDVLPTNTSTQEPPPSTLVRTVRTVTLLLISFMAIFGNILVVTAVLKYRKLRTPTNIFIKNLAVSNFVVGILLIFMATNVVMDRNVLGTYGCTAWGFLMGILGISSTYTMALVAVARFLLVARPTTARRIFIPLHYSLLLSLMPWIFALLILLGTVLGWTTIIYNPRTRACSYSRQQNPAFQFFSIVFGLVVPLVCIIVFYSLLYWTVLRSRRRITGQVMVTKDSENQNKSSDHKLTKMLVTIFLVYIVCSGPYSLVNIIDSDGQRIPEYVHILSTWILFSNTAINPVIYGLMNKNFKDAYVALVGWKWADSINSNQNDKQTTTTVKQVSI